jgi:hypothetical protein
MLRETTIFCVREESTVLAKLDEMSKVWRKDWQKHQKYSPKQQWWQARPLSRPLHQST